jgi:hypothetical protein
MNPKLIITLIITISLAIVLFIYFQFSPARPVPGEEIATSTATSTTEDLIVYPTIPSPLTLASLQALPDWNPTMAVEGMKRVEDNNPELEVKNLPIHIEEITSNNSSSTFVVKYLEPEVNVDACEKYGLVGNPPPYLLFYNCLETPPELFDELVIISKETGEVLHKYKLKENYSFAGRKFSAEGDIVSIYPDNSDSINTPKLSLYISNWKNFRSQDIYTTSQNYVINLLTGEITEVKRN